MQQQFSFFYKRYGLRRLQSLLSPITFILEQFPKDSLLHYVNYTNDSNEVDTSKLYLSNYPKKILIDFPEDLREEKGRPIKKPVILKNIAREFLSKNGKQFKYMKEPHKVIKDEYTLFLYNYCYLNEKYKYVEMPMNIYNKWWNIQKTIWFNANQIANETNRHQFFIIDVDSDLPSYSLLKIYSEKTNPTMLKIFDNDSKLMLLEIFKWFNPKTRLTSIFSELEDKNINKVNFMFNVNNRFCLINLGYLNSWIKGNENTTEITSVMQLDHKQIEKIFLKFLLTLTSISPDVIEEQTESNIPNKDIDTPEDKEENLEIKEEKEDYLADHEDGTEEDNTGYPDDNMMNSTYLLKDKNGNNISNVADKELDKLMNSDISINSYLNDVDEELKILDKTNKKKLKDQGIKLGEQGEELAADIEEDNISEQELNDLIYKNKTSTEILNDQVNEYVDYGLLSAADYRKAKKEIDSFSEIKDPYDPNKKLSEQIIITQEDIAINQENITMKDIDIVADKSMLESSLMSFDKDYVNKVMRKDILAMVSSIQNSGVIIKKYEIEEDNSVLGDYEHHRLELKPLDGAASTIHFRIPKIKQDGTFVSGSNKYVMRKQRTD